MSTAKRLSKRWRRRREPKTQPTSVVERLIRDSFKAEAAEAQDDSQRS